MHTTMAAPEPMRRFNMIERNILHKRLDTKANNKEAEKVKLLDSADFEKDGAAAVAMCNYVKAIYNYMYTTQELAKKGITVGDMKRQEMFHRGGSGKWNQDSLSKVKKNAEECAKND